MKIARKFQVFDTDVVLIDKDAARLTPHLSSWRSLHEIMLLGVNEPDLKRLVVLELLGQKRRQILQRLIGRISSIQTSRVIAKVNLCLKSK
jgi:hypothetical protein